MLSDSSSNDELEPLAGVKFTSREFIWLVEKTKPIPRGRRVLVLGSNTVITMVTLSAVIRIVTLRKTSSCLFRQSRIISLTFAATNSPKDGHG